MVVTALWVVIEWTLINIISSKCLKAMEKKEGSIDLWLARFDKFQLINKI